MADPIIGRGVRFPFRPGPGGGFERVDGEALLAQSIRLVLATAVGERVMRYAFGSELPRMIFEPITGDTLALIRESTRTALRDHEKRIRVIDVSAEPHPIERARVDVHVEYEILRTSRRGNLVHPLYLQEG